MRASAIFIALLLLLSACTQSGSPTGAAVQESLCQEPYFEYKAGNCCLDKDSNRICDVDEAVAEEAVEDAEDSDAEPQETIQDTPPPDTFEMHPGESIRVDTVGITLNTISAYSGSLQIEVDVNGQVFPMKGTQAFELLFGKRITLLSYNSGVNIQGGPFVTLKVEPFSLAADEALLYQGHPLDILGETLSVMDVLGDGSVIVDRVGTEDTLQLYEGKVKEVGAVKVTLLKAFEKPYRKDEYIWIRYA